jgi:hypothetical protein
VRAVIASLLTALGLLVTNRANATPRSIFEPTDLELEDPGVLNLDMQLGLVRGDPSRGVAPDLEIDLGLAPNVELDLDTAYTREGPAGGELRLQNQAYDPLWLSTKLGLFATRDARGRAWAIGTQLGPRFALARDARSVGYEGLLLIGRSIAPLHLVLNAGVVIDPSTARAPRRVGVEIGLDLKWELDDAARWSLLGELGVLRALTDDPHQLYATLGFAYAVGKYLDVSAIGLVGFLSQGDRYGLLLGFSPKLRLFG